MLERYGAESITGRELFLIEADGPGDIPASLPLPSRHFACLLAWDTDEVDSAAIARVARHLLLAGAAYVCTWGKGCQRVHDLVDQESTLETDGSESVVMTTWHENEPLSEAIWFLLFAAWPDPTYEATCRSSIGIAIGSGAYASEMRTAFANPKGFSDSVLAGK